MKPYKGFASYGLEDRGLFAARENDTKQFAQLVARADVRLILLHGATGCGKSSFLRAGVIPYLDELRAGFAFVKDPDNPQLRPDDTASKAVFLRSTGNPLEALTHAVFRLADRGYEFMSAEGTASLTFPDAKRGCASDEEFAALVDRDPQELVAALERLSAAMPHKPVLIIDQGEEVITLRRDPRHDARAAAFFTFLNAFAATRWRLTLIVSLRTDYFGVFRFRLRQQSPTGDVAVHEYYLDELSQADMTRAIEQPTSTAPLPGLGVPREVFRFSFEPGLAERIAGDIAKAATTSGLVSGALPFLQVVCDSLYRATKPADDALTPWTIAGRDYVPRPEVDTIARYIDGIIDEFLAKRGIPEREVAREHWKEVLASLVKIQPNGLITTDLKTIDELRGVTNKIQAHFDDMIDYLAADDQSVLRRIAVSEFPSSTLIDRFSLRHDAIGLAFRAWQTRRDTFRQQLVADDVMRHFMPRVDRVELRCGFDESGSGEHVRRWSGVHSPQTVVDFRIPYAFTVSPPGKVILPTEVTVNATEAPALSALPVRFVETASSPHSVRGYIEICGVLGADSGFVGFEVRQRFERGFLMSRAAVDEAYGEEEWRTEYAGISVQAPTGSLYLSIAFPRSFRLRREHAGPVVFFGRGETVHDAELARISPKFQLSGTGASLEVDDPLPGLQYAIYWTPPT